jgi:hypothetical protein
MQHAVILNITGNFVVVIVHCLLHCMFAVVVVCCIVCISLCLWLLPNSHSMTELDATNVCILHVHAKLFSCQVSYHYYGILLLCIIYLIYYFTTSCQHAYSSTLILASTCYCSLTLPLYCIFNHMIVLYRLDHSCNLESVRCSRNLTVKAVCTAAGSVVMYLAIAL